MSSPLAIAAVTTTICDLLNNGLIDHDLSPMGSFVVTALPPDRIETGNTEANRLNLFLYRVSPNQGWRNEGLPSHDARNGRVRLSNPPLALDLHYLLTAYGSADRAAEILLGYAMELLHDARVLTRQDIRTALTPDNPIGVALMPPDPQGRKAADLADQIEQVKLAPHYLSADELSRLWTAMQARYRPSMAYQASTVLIQGTRPTRNALPVLTMGPNDRGVHAQPDLEPPAPTIPTVTSLHILAADTGATRLAAELGDAVELRGVLLDGDNVTAEFRHRRLSSPIERKVASKAANQVRVTLPQDAAATAAWPAGNYTVALRIERAGKTRVTSEVPFSLAPRLLPAPTATGTAANPQLTLQVLPQLWPEQRVEVFVAGEPISPGAIAAKTATLTMSLKGVSGSDTPVPVSLRVDGVESQLVRDRRAEPPTFDPGQMVGLPS